MRLRPEHAFTVLSRVDPARLRGGWRVGLRDGALLALVAAGLNAVEIAALRASAITMSGGHVVVSVYRNGSSWPLPLSTDLGARVLAWLSEHRVWATPEFVFPGIRGPLTAIGVRKVLLRYGSRRTPRRPAGERRRSR
jgi:hypothetical protein